MAGVKLWLPPSIVKFGCLIHDEQLSSNARRICRMVAVPSSQIALFVMLVPGKKSWLSIVGKRCMPQVVLQCYVVWVEHKRNPAFVLAAC